MTTKTVRILSIAIFLLYVFSLTFLTLNINNEVQEGLLDARVQFDRIAQGTEKISVKTGFMTFDYVTGLKSLITESPSVISVVISNDESTFFAYPLNSDFVTTDNKGHPVLQSVSPQVKVFSSSVFVEGEDRLTVSSAMYTVLPQKVFTILLYTFFMILGITLVALVFAIYVSTRMSKTADSSKAKIIQPDSNTQTAETGLNIQNSVTFSDSTDTQKVPDLSELTDESFFEDEIQSIISDFSDDPVASDAEETIDETKNSTESLENIHRPTETNETQRRNLEQRDPMGLFSPKTGLGWESYLETRLDAELIRSASGEQDLALCIIRIIGLDHTMPAARRIADLLFSYFNFRDLLFEYKNDGYSSVNYSMDTNQAMMYAEKIIIDVQKILSECNLDFPVGIGISTRSQRLITGTRLIDEAEVALKKAFEEKDLPIVAFKINTEKYHQYVSGKLRGTNAKKPD